MTTPSPIGRGELHVPGKDWLTTQEFETEVQKSGRDRAWEPDDWPRSAGKVWRDLDGNIVEPGWPAWVNWVAIGVILAVIGVVRGCA